jgi:hypothetical protein
MSDPGAAARIQRLIDSLPIEGEPHWLWRVCREEHNVFPLAGNDVYLWAIRPDGVVLCLDHEAFGVPVEEETDPVKRFAAIVYGARLHPELRELIPEQPEGARLCRSCAGTGLQGGEDEPVRSCYGCGGLGWTGPPPWAQGA